MRIDPLEELRELEGIARRQTGRRGVFGAERAALLRRRRGRPRRSGSSAWPDVEIDLEHPSLRGVGDADVFDALVAGCGADVVR